MTGYTVFNSPGIPPPRDGYRLIKHDRQAGMPECEAGNGEVLHVTQIA